MLEIKANSVQSKENTVLVHTSNFYLTLKYEYNMHRFDAIRESDVLSEYNADLSRNIFDYNLIIIPIQKEQNWSLAVRLLNL